LLLSVFCHTQNHLQLAVAFGQLILNMLGVEVSRTCSSHIIQEGGFGGCRGMAGIIHCRKMHSNGKTRQRQKEGPVMARWATSLQQWQGGNNNEAIYFIAITAHYVKKAEPLFKWSHFQVLQMNHGMIDLIC
jgi:hypothetical protein